MGSSLGGDRREERIPRVSPDFDPLQASLTPVEGFLLSRIDGCTSWTALREIGGLSPDEVDERLERWAKQGLIVLEAAGASAGASRGANGASRVATGSKPAADRAGADAQAPPARSAAMDAAEQPPAASVPQGDPRIDRALDLAPELQARILAFEEQLDRPYPEILGIDPRADAREIKRAYFRLSKQFHPDRYFRRNVGAYAERLDRVFKKIAEAYELMSDPTTRAEIERSLASAPAPEAGAYRVQGGESERIAPEKRARGYRVPSRMENLEKLRARFKIPKKVLVERQFKARQFFRSARAAAHEGRFLEAAASMRLAIAFDPANPEYKKGFADIQADVYRARADDLIAQADGAGAQADALKLLEEALHYRPVDTATLARAAALSLDVGEVERAREHAETACEVAPEEAVHHVLMARALRRLGQRAPAAAALRRARDLDPKHPDVLAEQQQQSRARR